MSTDPTLPPTDQQPEQQAGHQPDRQPDERVEPAPGGPHAPSLVTGLAALLVVVLVGLGVLTDVRVDAVAVAAAALVVLGGLLVAGGLAAGLRGR